MPQPQRLVTSATTRPGTAGAELWVLRLECGHTLTGVKRSARGRREHPAPVRRQCPYCVTSSREEG